MPTEANYPDHWLFEFGGTYIGDGELPEIWQCGVRGVPNDGSGLSLDDADGFLGNLQPRFGNWYANHSRCRSDAFLNWIKCNRIRPDGNYADSGITNMRTYTTPVGGPVSSSVPTILTVCWSWRTVRTRGPGSHGRIYPPVAIPAGPSMVISNTERIAQLVAAKDFLGVLAEPDFPTLGNGFAACVVSDQNVLEPVTAIKVGNVIDVQRRRKNQLAETYLGQSGPPWSTTVE
jgi:hypothetical protein